MLGSTQKNRQKLHGIVKTVAIGAGSQMFHPHGQDFGLPVIERSGQDITQALSDLTLYLRVLLKLKQLQEYCQFFAAIDLVDFFKGIAVYEIIINKCLYLVD